ncbi:EamA family transporter [Roseateles sp.]|uniref:EamA family transporter n=1 Tax=Roseateles sp. TaxID=1971397 RepID=UPI00392B0626
MPLHALACVLVAALLHAIWNLAAKKAQGGAHFTLASALGVSLVWLPVAAWAAVDDLPHWTATTWAVVFASAIVHLGYFNCLMAGYRAADLTIVYPVARGSAPLLSALCAVAFFGEHLGWLGSVGLAGVVAGIVLMTAGPQFGKPHDPEATVARRRRAGVWWGLATGSLIAGYSVIDAYAVKVLLVSPLLLDYFGNVLRAPLMLPTALRDARGFWPEVKRTWKAVLTISTLGPIAYMLVLYAMREAPLSRVAPARELSMLFAALLGGQLLGEGERGWRIGGAALIATGVIGLAL